LEDVALGFNGRRAKRIQGYVPFKKAVSIAKQKQPWGHKPHRPITTNFTWLVYVNVVAGLGVGKKGDVGLYLSPGMALDYFHGVDFFVEYQGNIATVDISMYRKDDWKADFLITLEDIQSNRFCDIAHKGIAGCLKRSVERQRILDKEREVRETWRVASWQRQKEEEEVKALLCGA